jgi:hypothetical protein
MDIKSRFFKLAGIACPTASSRHRSTQAILGCAVAGMAISMVQRMVLKTFRDAKLLSSPTTDLMETMMCRVDEEDFPIDPRQLTPQDWHSFKQRVTERAQQARQQALRAAAIALPRVLLAGACYGGSLLTRIAGKAWSAYALRREWRAAVRALDDRMLMDIGLGRSGDRIRNLRQRSRERIASGTHQLARMPGHFSTAANPDRVNNRCGHKAKNSI